MQCRLLFLFLALTQAGCGLSRSLLSGVARDEFSRQHSCPEERMTLKAIAVKPADLFTASEPPPDVAADPGRLAVFRSTDSENMSSYVHLHAMNVTGCGFEQTYFCWEEPAYNGETIDYFCEEIDLTDANARLGNFDLRADAMRALREQLSALR